MVKRSGVILDRAFGALADPTRRAIVARLAGGERSVGELVEPFAISWPAVTRHIKVLESAGLVRRRVSGRVHHIRLDARSLREVSAWTERYRTFWERRMEGLEQYLSEEKIR